MSANQKQFQRKPCSYSSWHDRLAMRMKTASAHTHSLQQSTTGVQILNCIGRNWPIHLIALSCANSPATHHQVASMAEKQISPLSCALLCSHSFAAEKEVGWGRTGGQGWIFDQLPSATDIRHEGAMRADTTTAFSQWTPWSCWQLSVGTFVWASRQRRRESTVLMLLQSARFLPATILGSDSLWTSRESGFSSNDIVLLSQGHGCSIMKAGHIIIWSTHATHVVFVAWETILWEDSTRISELFTSPLARHLLPPHWTATCASEWVTHSLDGVLGHPERFTFKVFILMII